jgi:hypothetical protein
MQHPVCLSCSSRCEIANTFKGRMAAPLTVSRCDFRRGPLVWIARRGLLARAKCSHQNMADGCALVAGVGDCSLCTALCGGGGLGICVAEGSVCCLMAERPLLGLLAWPGCSLGRPSWPLVGQVLSCTGLGSPDDVSCLHCSSYLLRLRIYILVYHAGLTGLCAGWCKARARPAAAAAGSVAACL